MRSSGLQLPTASPGSEITDLLALGEVMLRLDPGDVRIRGAHHFDVWEGGGEYNVARTLSAVFGMRTGVLTALVDNEIGRLVETRIRAGGVDPSHILWRPFDGIGRTLRNGLNFTERGYGVRQPLGVSDRGHTASAALAPDDWDFTRLFSGGRVRWFHSGGIFAGLSATARDTALAAAHAARDADTIVSMDLNFRPSLWADRAAAAAVFRELASVADVLVAGRTDLASMLNPIARHDEDHLAAMVTSTFHEFPNLKLVTGLDRTAADARHHALTAWAFTRDRESWSAQASTAVLDRVGSGDSYCAGLAYALLSGETPGVAVKIGLASALLAMSTPGDQPMSAASEVIALAQAGFGAADVRR